jgi:phage terminase large subunit-like protein
MPLEMLEWTVAENRLIPHVPTTRQIRFLELECLDSLYGGSAGGGKSDALLMAALMFAEVPGYSALVLRRTFADLKLPGALIDRGHEWLTGKAKWHAQEHRWRFASGATLQFGYCEQEKDVYRYLSSEFQFIGLDEATQFTEFQVRYLFSRLRRRATIPVPLRFRLASNPGNVGHEFVKRRYMTDPKDRVYIRARLQDNPHLDREQYLRSLSELDPVTRAQLLDGDWDVTEEGRFRRAWLRHYHHYGSDFQLGPPGARIVAADRIVLRFLTIDSAATIKQTASHDPDYTAISSWALAEGLLFGLGCVITRCEVPEIPALVAREYVKHKADMVYCCCPGTEKAVPQILSRHSSPRMNVANLDAQGDKLQKAAIALNMAEAGRVWFPAPGVRPEFPLEDVESQLLRFTGDPKQSGHDDIWDCLGIAGRVAKAKEAPGANAVPYLIRK